MINSTQLTSHQVMTLVSWSKKWVDRIGICQSSRRPLPQTSLASSESLETPLVGEIVLAADLHCPNCQERVAHVISRIQDAESLVVHVQEKKVSLIRSASVRCEGKPSRKVADVHYNVFPKISRIMGFSSEG